MTLRAIAGIAFLSLGVGLAAAQSHQPYAGMQERPIKALSPQRISDLKAGRGMGYALAAELNGYPGPLHVLEFADQLALTKDQRAEIKRLYDAMQSEAKSLGERLIAQEADLDRQFASRAVSVESLASATAAIGATEGALRSTHLKYHLSTARVLDPAQVQHYAQLRGYAGGQQPHQPHQHRH